MTKIELKRKTEMSELLEAYPNLGKDMLLNGGCFLLITKKGSNIIYDCRGSYSKNIIYKLPGTGYMLDRTKVLHKCKKATRHIELASKSIYYSEIKTIYNLGETEFDAFIKLIRDSQKEFDEYLSKTIPIHREANDEHFLCAPKLSVIVHTGVDSYTEKPAWCKADAAYNAIEELSLIAPYFTGFTWWYYPGRIYLSCVKWYDISREQYMIAKEIILQKEDLIFSRLNDIINAI